jgi:hypothetical protein
MKHYILFIICILILYLIYININISNFTNYEFINYTGNAPIKNIENPLDEMKKYNVVFGATVRNVEPFIKKNLEYIDQCGKQFKNYKVIIYENDSNDNTRTILQENKKDNYEYIFEDNITEPMRTMRISNGRNKILEKIRETNYDYMIIIDLDDVNNSGMFVDTIKSCFEYTGWDILTGNQSGIYYDLWALRKKNDMEYDCWKMVHENNSPDAANLYVWSKAKHYDIGQLLEVDSAFGGIAIYKLSSIPSECKYVGKYDDGKNELCEHVEFNRCIKKNGGNIYINTSFLTY